MWALRRIGDTRVRGAATPLSQVHALARDGFELDRFMTAPGVELVGLVKRPAASQRAWVIFFPGNSRPMLEGARAYLDTLAQGRGWGLATWAYRGFDASTGELAGSTVGHDAEAAVRRLTERYGANPEHIHLIGFSLGSAFATHAAQRYGARAEALGSVTLLSPGLTGPRVPRLLAPLVRGGFQLRPLLHDVRAPLLVIAAASDPVHPVDFNAHVVRAKLGARVNYLELPGGHVEPLSAASALDRVREFIERPR